MRQVVVYERNFASCQAYLRVHDRAGARPANSELREGRKGRKRECCEGEKDTKTAYDHFAKDKRRRDKRACALSLNNGPGVAEEQQCGKHGTAPERRRTASAQRRLTHKAERKRPRQAGVRFRADKLEN